MNLLRKHWYDIGIILSLTVLLYLFINGTDIHSFEFLMWISLVTLFIHQFEEYRFPGYFPGMFNKVMFNSPFPDRYPLNTRTSFIINVGGWLLYFMAALLANRALWLCILTNLVSLGNFVVHTFVFNIKGKRIYNPGMATSVLLFLPLGCYFFYFIHTNHMVQLKDYIIGIPVGIMVNYIGIFKVIEWLKNEKTLFVFEERQVDW
jgi:hypothetical protein